MGKKYTPNLLLADSRLTGGGATGINRECLDVQYAELTAALAANVGTWAAGVITDVSAVLTALNNLRDEIDAL